LIQRKIFYRKNETPTPDWSGIIYPLPEALEGSREIYSGKREMGANKIITDSTFTAFGIPTPYRLKQQKPLNF
jgi:hypothetical protein